MHDQLHVLISKLWPATKILIQPTNRNQIETQTTTRTKTNEDEVLVSNTNTTRIVGNANVNLKQDFFFFCYVMTDFWFKASWWFVWEVMKRTSQWDVHITFCGVTDWSKKMGGGEGVGGPSIMEGLRALVVLSSFILLKLYHL